MDYSHLLLRSDALSLCEHQSPISSDPLVPWYGKALLQGLATVEGASRQALGGVVHILPCAHKHWLSQVHYETLPETHSHTTITPVGQPSPRSVNHTGIEGR